MQSALSKQTEFLQLVLNHIPSFVFWKDTECVYQGCNMNFAKTGGFESSDDIIGKSDYDMPWSKEDADFYRKIDKEVMKSGKSKINFEEPQTVEEGKTKWLRTSKIPLHDEHGKVIGILGAYEDITKRKTMELALVSGNKSLKKLNSKLELMNTDLEQFAYSTTHDLKEPLRMIGGFIGLLEKQYTNKLDPTAMEYMGFIKEGAERMSLLIRQIADYSNIENVEEEFSKNSFKSLVEDTIKELVNPISRVNAKIITNLPEDKIICQPGRIKRIFRNLIINGIKFNSSPEPKVEINFEEKETFWLFSVRDNGIGIEETYKELVFKPFKRLNTRDKFAGNGIGLAICRKIVFLHEGEIYFKPNSANGTTFYFTISKNIDLTNQVENLKKYRN